MRTQKKNDLYYSIPKLMKSKIALNLIKALSAFILFLYC